MENKTQFNPTRTFRRTRSMEHKPIRRRELAPVWKPTQSNPTSVDSRTGLVELSAFAAVQGVSESHIKAICRDVGVRILSGDGQWFVVEPAASEAIQRAALMPAPERS